MATLHRNENGKLPAYAWPGGYPIVYITADGACLCPACANGENGSEASEDKSAPADWRIEGQDIHWDDEPIVCDHCGAEIESAYGNPDDD